MLPVKRLRKERQITQRELSILTGITERTIISIETNPNYSSRSATLEKLADFFGVSTDEILGRKRRSFSHEN